jgi:hypothetical protein
LNVFEWNWDYISNNKFFPTDIITLKQFKEKINWSILTGSNTIQQKFNPKSWDNSQQWFNNTDKYLKIFNDYWDWQILSKNESLNYSRSLLQKHKNKNWDWDYLTEFGKFLTVQKKDEENYLEQLIRNSPK